MNKNEENLKPNQMTKEEAGDKGVYVRDYLASIWELIEWKQEKEDGDPYVKVTLYKSGKFTVESYADNEIAEFQIENASEISEVN